MSKDISNPFKNLAQDIPASIVVFLVAMPLCLGIALASGAPLFSGLIAGMIGGIVVGSISKSSLGVSGPAAGLAVIVLGAIQDYGFETFLVAVVLAGVIQIVLGFLRGGIIAYYFPSSVIMGMLAGIGVIIFMKQIPHAFGYDGDPLGDIKFLQPDGENTFTELVNMLNYISPGALIIAGISLAILLLWETKLFKGLSFTRLIPGPLVAVIVGIILGQAFIGSSYQIGRDHLVDVPVAEGFSGFLGNFTLPDFAALARPEIYLTAVIIAVVASLETLLCVEATDKLDPYKRVTPTNRELIAQGVGNSISGLIGGIPVTQVIVRSSANIQSGGRTKASAVIHGFLILISIIAIPSLLNMIPLATLAAILLVVGYKLARPSLWKKMYKQGKMQFVPFVVTVVGVVFSDLLIGLGIGLMFSIIFLLYDNYKIPFRIGKVEGGENRGKMRIELAQEVTFINKARILNTLRHVPDNTDLIIDASKTHFIHHDILEVIEDFKVNAPQRNISLKLIDLRKHKQSKPSPQMHIEYSDPDHSGMETEVIDPASKEFKKDRLE